MAEIIPFRSADSVAPPESDPGEFVEAINELSRQWTVRRRSRPSRAGLVADIVDIRTGRPIPDLETVLATLGRPMSELEVVLVRFGAAIAERERQQHAAGEKPE
jgi:hypothetical protein